jgi:hypothetical protein
VQRLFKVNDTCIVGASGEVSDFQELQTYLTQLAEEDYMCDDGISYTPKEIHSYLCRVMYNKRSEYAVGPCPLLFHFLCCVWVQIASMLFGITFTDTPNRNIDIVEQVFRCGHAQSDYDRHDDAAALIPSGTR